MADEEQVRIIRQGSAAWNAWREQHPDIKPDLGRAKLRGTYLCEADLSRADLSEADLRGADLSRANLCEAYFGGADLSEAKLGGACFRNTYLGRADLREAQLDGASLSKVYLDGAYLYRAKLHGADLNGACLSDAKLGEADLAGADLSEAKLVGADISRACLREAKLVGADISRANLGLTKLVRADLSGAKLYRAILSRADLSEASLVRADLRWTNFLAAKLGEAKLNGANLEGAHLVDTGLENANLAGCRVYGVSAWDLKLDKTTQGDLIITRNDQPKVTVDNLEVAQFIYLLLNNERIRHVIDTITSKLVLVLGRFTPERKAILDSLRDELRRQNLTPVLFDFDKPKSKDLTGTVQTLANMARFIIADLTDPSSVPHELALIVPSTVVPVQPILLKRKKREYAMFVDLKDRYHWVLEPYRYDSSERLLIDLGERVIGPAETKAENLRRARVQAEVDVTRPTPVFVPKAERARDRRQGSDNPTIRGIATKATR